VRVGVGRPISDIDPSDFVLKQFNEREKKDLKEVITKAQKCIETILKQGPESAMNIFHRENPNNSLN